METWDEINQRYSSQPSAEPKVKQKKRVMGVPDTWAGVNAQNAPTQTQQDTTKPFAPVDFSSEVSRIKQGLSTALQTAKSDLDKMPKGAREIGVPWGFAGSLVKMLPGVKEAEKKRKEIRNLELAVKLHNDFLRNADRQPDKIDSYIQGFKDVFQEPEKLIPIAGAGFTFEEATETTAIAKKLNAGKKLSSYEKSVVEKARAKGLPIDRDWTYYAGRAVGSMPTYIAEFAMIGSLTKAPIEAGVSKLLGKGAEIAVPQLIQKGWELPAKIGVNQLIATGIGIAAQAGTFSAIKTPADVAEKAIPYQEQLQNPVFKDFYETLGGEFDWKKEAVKSFGSNFVEVLTEYVGGVVEKPIGVLAKATLGKWCAKRGIVLTSKIFKKLAEQVSWNGIFGEVFEEEIAERLQSFIEGRQYKSIITPEGIERLLTETLTIVSFGGLSRVPITALELSYGARQALTQKKPVAEPVQAPPVKIEPEQKGVKITTDAKLENTIQQHIETYKSTGGYTLGTETPDISLRDLENLIKTENGQRVAQTMLENALQSKELPVSKDGNIALYRAGEISDKNNLISFTYDKAVAELFRDAGVAKGRKINIYELNVKPVDIALFIGAAEKEVLLARDFAMKKLDIVPAIEMKERGIVDIREVYSKSSPQIDTVDISQRPKMIEECGILLERLNEYTNTYKKSAVEVVANKKTIAKVETVKFPDGKYTYSLSATTNISGFSSPFGFDAESLFSSEQEAIDQAVEKILNWAREQLARNPNKTEEVLLNKIIKEIGKGTKEKTKTKTFAEINEVIRDLPQAQKEATIKYEKGEISADELAKILATKEQIDIRKKIKEEVKAEIKAEAREAKIDGSIPSELIPKRVAWRKSIGNTPRKTPDSWGNSFFQVRAKMPAQVVKLDITFEKTVISLEAIASKENIPLEFVETATLSFNGKSLVGVQGKGRKKFHIDRIYLNPVAKLYPNSFAFTGKESRNIVFKENGKIVAMIASIRDVDNKDIKDIVPLQTEIKDDIITYGKAKQQPRDKRVGEEIEKGVLPDTSPVGVGQPSDIGKDASERSGQVARGRLDISGTGAGERLGTRLETNEQITAFIDKYTTVEDDGRVVVDAKKVSKDSISHIDFTEAAKNYTPAGGLEKKGAEGRGLLDEYYTPPEVVALLRQAVSKYIQSPVKGTYKLLEPSVGTGRFLQNIFEGWDLDDVVAVNITGYETNRTTAGIVAGVHQYGAKIYNLPFEDIFIDERGTKKEYQAIYNLVIGNPPYGKHRGVYKGLGEETLITKYEEYFIKRSLDLTKKDGIVAMVVPSSILRSGSSFGKNAIAKLGKLVDAYRLPNKIFGTTDIGTDILVFKRTATANETKNLISDNFFKDNPDKIIGKEAERKGRFGVEKYVEGGIKDITARLTAKEEPETEVSSKEETQLKKVVEANYPQETTAEKQDILNSVKEEIDTGKIVDTKAYVKNWNKDVNQVEPEIITEQIAKKKKPRFAKKKAVEVAKEQKAILQPIKKKAGRINLQDLSIIDKNDPQGIDSALVALNVEATGEIKNEVLKDLMGKDLERIANYSDKLWYNNFNYFMGDIYERLDQLEKDKPEMSASQYNKQKKGLLKVLPERHPIERINISPNTPFVEKTMIYDSAEKKKISLQEKFIDFTNELPSSAFGGASRWDIREYIAQQAVRGSDKARNSLVRVRRREVGDKLFKLFLRDELDDKQKKKVEDTYNRQFNSYYRPDYRRVLLTSKIYNTFKGNKLKIQPVQLQGIGFLVNKGLGILAHDVGVGKTLQAIVATGEMMKKGWAKRPLIITPSGNVYHQWIKEIQELLPDIKINDLANLGGGFKGDLATLEIEAGTISIITYGGFKRLGFTNETYNDLTKDLQDTIKNPNEKATKRKEELEKAGVGEIIGRGMKGTKAERCFEELGFDLLVQDEVQNANHIIKGAKLKEQHKATEFRGLTVRPSALGIKTWLASQYIQKHNDNRNVFFLSATPFTNNPMEYYSILSLVARKRLEKMGLKNVNEFMNTFMDLTFDFEVTADGKYKERNSIRGFKNYQQFQKLLTEFIDFRDGEEIGIKRPKRISNKIMLHATKQQLDYMDETQELFSPENRKKGGTLTGINEMRKIAFSPYASRYYRGAMPTYKEFVDNSPKIKATVEAIRQNKKDNPEANQVIYSPIGIEYFPLIKDYLVREVGFKDKQVGVITGSVKGKTRVSIQKNFNEGDVKIIIGSDAIQEGVNLQKKTTDLYILALPWNFTEMKQVVGRVWRQGNEWKNIRVHTLLIENSSDVFQSQKLETKQKRYENSLKFKGDYVDVGDINYDDLKLDLITDPVMRVRVENAIITRRLKKDLTEARADYAYLMRKATKLTDAQKEVEDTKKMIEQHMVWLAEAKKDEDKGDIEYYEKRIGQTKVDLRKRQKALIKMTAEYKEKGVIDSAELGKKRADIDAKEAKVNEMEKEYDAKLEEAEKIQVERTVKPNDFSVIWTKLAKENLTFFQKAEPVNTKTIVPSGIASAGGGKLGSFEDITKLPETTKPAASRLKIYEKVKDLIKKYAKTVGEDYLPRRASGVYYPETTNIRLRGMNALSVAAHEITHFLDHAHKISERLMGIKGYSITGNPIYEKGTYKMRKEMTDLYERYYPGGKRKHKLKKRMLEGFATLLEKYIEQPTTISLSYPHLVREFLKEGGEYYEPVMGEIITDLREFIVEYQGLPALDKIMARIVNDEVNVNKESFLNFWQKLKTEAADEIYPVEIVGKKAGVRFTKADPSLWAREYKSSSALILNNIRGNRGYWGWRNGDITKLHDFNWKDLISNIEDTKTAEEFGAYLVARRDYFQYQELTRLKEQPDQLTGEAKDKALAQYGELKTILDNDGFTEKETAEAYLQNKDRFAKFAKKYDELVREDLNFLYDSKVQLINHSQYSQLISQEGYASFKRYFYDEIIGDEKVSLKHIRFGRTKVSSLLKRTGSQKPIINPLSSALTNHAEITRKCLKQIVYNKNVEIAIKNPELGIFQKLQLKVIPDDTGRFFYPQEKDPNIIMGRVNYKRVPVLVDSTIKRTLDEVLNFQNIHFFEKLLMGTNRLFTKGTTGIYPAFAIANISVDQPSAMAQSRNKYIPIYDTLREAVKLLDNTDPNHTYLQEYFVMGGERQTFVGWQNLAPNELFSRIAGERKGLLKLVDYLDKGADILSLPSKWSEIATRATEYIKARKAGKSSIVALEEAGRVTAPFHHIGRLGGGRTGQTIMKSIPFFNPSIQVLAQTAETLETKEGRQRYAYVVAAVTAASIAGLGLIMIAGSDDQKKLFADLHPDELNKYIWLPNIDKKTLIKIRVPDQMTIIATLANMLWADKKLQANYTAGEYLTATMAWLPTQFNPTDLGRMFLSWLPQAIKPATLAITNIKDFPKIMPLESESQKRKSPGFRYYKSTSELAKLLGRKLNLSPIKLDYLLEGYVGRVSRFFTGKKKAYSLFKSMKREYYFQWGRKMQKYYEMRDKNNQLYSDYKNERREFKLGERTVILKERAELKKIGKLMKVYGDIDIDKSPKRASQVRNQILKLVDEL